MTRPVNTSAFFPPVSTGRIHGPGTRLVWTWHRWIVLRKSIVVHCFFWARPMNTGHVNSAPVFTARVGGISTNQKFFFYRSIASNVNATSPLVFIVQILFSICAFCIIATKLHWKQNVYWHVSVKYSAVSDNLCIGILLVFIANNSVFFCFMYAVIDTSLTKQYFFH